MILARSFHISSNSFLRYQPSSGTEEKDDSDIKELRSEDEWHRLAYKKLAKDGDEMVADSNKSIILFINFYIQKVYNLILNF